MYAHLNVPRNTNHALQRVAFGDMVVFIGNRLCLLLQADIQGKPTDPLALEPTGPLALNVCQPGVANG